MMSRTAGRWVFLGLIVIVIVLGILAAGPVFLTSGQGTPPV